MPPAPAEAVRKLAENNARFALKLYHEQAKSDGNVVSAPHSISTAIAMLYVGARGESESEIAAALEFSQPRQELDAAFNGLERELAARGEDPEGLTLRMNNDLWFGEQLPPARSYTDALAENYSATGKLITFANQSKKARQTINGEVSRQTEGNINELIPPEVINNNTVVVLTNSVYMKANWAEPFGDIGAGPFQNLDGSSAMKPMMQTTTGMQVAERERFTAVSIPYQGGKLALTIVLPDPGEFAQVEAALDAETLTAINKQATYETVQLVMPKFRIESKLDVKMVVEGWGFRNLFIPGMANLTGIMDDRRLFVQGIPHQAFIEVDEQGTTAGGATAVVVGADGVQPEVSREIAIDRPFIWTIQDAPTGAVLFIGRTIDLD